MRQCFFYFHTGLIHRTEIFLANSAKWTNPIFWKIFKCCTWLYAILGVADSWVIHPTADITYIFLHNRIVLIVICCKYTHYTSNDKAKRVEVLLIYNNYNSVYYLWETFLCKKLLCVPWVLWEYSSPTDCTDQHRWFVALVRPRNPQNSQKFGCVSGCVGTAGCHTLLHLCKSVISVGGSSLQETSVRSVGSVGYSSPTDYTDQHRWLVALVAAWVWQDAIPSYICVNLCYLWEALLYKKLLCVPWVLWEYSSPTDYTLSLQKKAIRLNNQGKTMIAKDSFVPLL